MQGDRKILDEALGHALAGKGAHVETKTVFSALDWTLAGRRPEGAPHSIYQLLNHMLYWQVWVVNWLDGEPPPLPKHASGSWPGDVSPANRAEWMRTIRRFRSGLERVARDARKGDLLSKRGTRSRLGMLHTIASHNSYHAGQVVFLRQQLGAWPPPSGGLTW